MSSLTKAEKDAFHQKIKADELRYKENREGYIVYLDEVNQIVLFTKRGFSEFFRFKEIENITIPLPPAVDFFHFLTVNHGKSNRKRAVFQIHTEENLKDWIEFFRVIGCKIYRQKEAIISDKEYNDFAFKCLWNFVLFFIAIGVYCLIFMKLDELLEIPRMINGLFLDKGAWQYLGATGTSLIMAVTVFWVFRRKTKAGEYYEV